MGASLYFYFLSAEIKLGFRDTFYLSFSIMLSSFNIIYLLNASFTGELRL